MSYAQAIFLATVQGITEFLPISSSGHLVILQKFFGFNRPPVVFDILVHVGTLGAVLYFFRQPLTDFLNGLLTRKKTEINLLLLILLGTIPAGIIGFFLQESIHQIFSSLRLVGISLLITAGLLFSSKLIKMPKRDFEHLNWKDAFLVGLFQALAILPGVSRSGSTITTGLWRGLKRETAFTFSFYLAIPAILGALVFQIPSLFNSVDFYLNQGILGMIVAGIIGYFSLRILEKALKSARFYWFGFYCLFAGLIVLIA